MEGRGELLFHGRGKPVPRAPQREGYAPRRHAAEGQDPSREFRAARLPQPTPQPSAGFEARSIQRSRG
jgi:hypothetical protein